MTTQFRGGDASAADEQIKPYSCLVCRQRKVKCNRRSPCDNCVKAGSDCSFVPPVRGKRKRTKPAHEGMHAKLRRYEDMLKGYGAKLDPQSDDDSDSDGETPTSSAPATNPSPIHVDDARQPAATPATKPKLVVKEGSSRYFENSFWSSVDNEFHHPDDSDAAENEPDANGEEDELFLASLDHGQSPRSRLSEDYPPLHAFRKLKDVFMERIDPLIKVLHMPSFWADAVKAVEHPQKVPRSLEAAIFCFHLATVSVLNDEQCKNMFGESQEAIFGRSKALARQSLLNAGLIQTSSPMTLCAFLLFLIGVRGHLRHDSQYVLYGVALRLAMKMGLHRDGEALGLPPFEVEMRRRVWWHAAHMDFRTADMIGNRPSRDITLSDTKPPLNVEDEDLVPGMKEFPPERKGVTSISNCSVRCDILHFLGKLNPSSPFGASWDSLASDAITIERKDAMIDEMEDYFERKYLRYCDPTDPLHTISAIMMRSSVCKMRLHAHNPKNFASREGAVSQEERDIAFSNAMRIIQYASSANSVPSLHRYQWRIGSSYLWDMLIYVLIEARRRGTGADVDRVWPLVGTVIPEDSDIYKERPAAVNSALRKWILEAWGGYVTAMAARGQLEPETPEYIEKMRIAAASAAMAAGRAGVGDSASSSGLITSRAGDGGQNAPDAVVSGMYAFDGYNVPDLASFDMDPNEWLNWEQLLSGTGAMGKLNG